jgi:hypothetical protein
MAGTSAPIEDITDQAGAGTGVRIVIATAPWL